MICVSGVDLLELVDAPDPTDVLRAAKRMPTSTIRTAHFLYTVSNLPLTADDSHDSMGEETAQSVKALTGSGNMVQST